MPDGSTFTTTPARAAELVYGEHGFGLDRHTGAQHPTTFLFRDQGKREQLGWESGHVEDGGLIDGPFFGKQRRVQILGGAA